MNLGDYISSYLDGELTSAEDSQFRAMVSEDPLARDEFESAALIHVAMMNEAESITVPDDIFTETENTILHMMQAEKQAKTAASLKPFYGKRLVSLSAALMFLMLFVVNDDFLHSSLSLVRNNLQLSDIAIADITSNYSAKQNQLFGRNFGRKSQIINTNNVPSNEYKSISSQTEQPEHFSNVEDVRNTLKQNLLTSTQTNLPLADLKLGNNNSAPIVITQQSVASAIPPIPSNSKEQTYQAAAFFGTVVANNTPGIAAQHYSQSLGYSVSDGDYIGIEVGSITLNTISSNSVFSPNGVTVPPDQGQSKGLLEGSSDNGSTGNVGGGTNSYQNNNGKTFNKELVWGAAYFEHRFLHSSALQVNARLGVGSSSAGPILFGRSCAIYNVYKAFSITAGTEGRMFIDDSSDKIKHGEQVHTLLSVMYGLQVRF